MPSFIPLPDTPTPDLTTSTLLIPSISLGNIPQLTIDLLIHTFAFVKLGTLDDLYLYPFASPQDYATTATTTTTTAVSAQRGIAHAVEVYHCAALRVCLVQQRSPILPGCVDNYVTQTVMPFVKASGFKKVVVLDSLDAGVFEHVHAGDIEVYSSEILLSKSLESLKLSNETVLENEDEKEKDQHSDYVRCLLREFDLPRGEASKSDAELNDVDVSVLVSFVYEGDNFYDGEKLADKVIDFLGVEKKAERWVRPISWFGAYGDKPVPNAMEEGLFG
ncbi:Proteasome assembly chaperone 2 [Candida viswanathii]|uniref:Proteasome assembly chaperone 2 n=1 Tax=Candida viswanathii TaxID=5486 RepID=A0A367YPD8_9ASCO|nr:Proteasome assembly chaperone 2 [Candida viswanathii]